MARYTEVRELGAGATGRVVLAEHRRSHHFVAIKHLSPACFADPIRREMFRREAKYLASLTDPNVVRMLEYVESREGAAIVMEAVQGPSLRRMLAANGPCPPEVALTLLHGSLLGMIAAHRRGIVHRDYKPENVLIDASGRSKLADFGIAAPIGYGVPATGTPPYMAPEQWNGWPATTASDIYAASVVFYECLTGRRPFASGTLRGLQALHETEPPPLESVPATVRPLLATGMAKLPALRYRDVGVFLGELERVAAVGYGPDWRERGTRDLMGAASVLIAAFPLLAVGAVGAAGVAGALGGVGGVAGAAGASAGGLGGAVGGAAGSGAAAGAAGAANVAGAVGAAAGSAAGAAGSGAGVGGGSGLAGAGASGAGAGGGAAGAGGAGFGGASAGGAGFGGASAGGAGFAGAGAGAGGAGFGGAGSASAHTAGRAGVKVGLHALRTKVVIAVASAVVLIGAVVTAAAIGKVGPFAAKSASSSSAEPSGAPLPTAPLPTAPQSGNAQSPALASSAQTSAAATSTSAVVKLPDACSLLTAGDIAGLTGWAGAVPHPAGDDRSGCNWRIETQGGTVVSYGFAAASRERYDQIENIPGLQVIPGLGDIAKRGGDSTMIYWHGMIVQVVVFAPNGCCDTLDKQTAVARAILAKT